MSKLQIGFIHLDFPENPEDGAAPGSLHNRYCDIDSSRFRPNPKLPHALKLPTRA